jgi:hypothetical protein
MSFWGGINAKIPKTELQGKINLNGNINHAPNIFNNIRGVSNTYSLFLEPGIDYNVENKINSSFNLGFAYNNSTSTINESRNIRFLSFQPSASIVYYLPKDLEISTDIDYQYNPPVDPYPTSFHRFIWNSGISYRMLKNKNLTWRANVNDILNQNRGYSRTTTNNFNTERFFQTLGRYYMLSMIWTFNNGPMANQSNTKTGPPMPPGMYRRGGGGRRRY